MSDVEPALTARHRAGFHMGGEEQLGSCVSSRVCQHGIKAGAINVPAAAVWIEEEIAMARGGCIPGGANTVRFQWLGRKKSLPDAQLHQRASYLWRQCLANAIVLIGGLLDQRNVETTAAELECRHRTRGAAAGNHNIE